MQTRKCQADADANANANADANRIRTKNNMFPSPSVGDIIMTHLGSSKEVNFKSTETSEIQFDIIAIKAVRMS